MKFRHLTAKEARGELLPEMRGLCLSERGTIGP